MDWMFSWWLIDHVDIQYVLALPQHSGTWLVRTISSVLGAHGQLLSHMRVNCWSLIEWNLISLFARLYNMSLVVDQVGGFPWKRPLLCLPALAYGCPSIMEYDLSQPSLYLWDEYLGKDKQNLSLPMICWDLVLCDSVVHWAMRV